MIVSRLIDAIIRPAIATYLRGCADEYDHEIEDLENDLEGWRGGLHRSVYIGTLRMVRDDLREHANGLHPIDKGVPN
jgi:hypothetical protein